MVVVVQRFEEPRAKNVGRSHKHGEPLCGPVRVKVEVKDNQTTNTKVTAIMRDVGPRNYGEFNEPLFCNKAVLWAVD